MRGEVGERASGRGDVDQRWEGMERGMQWLGVRDAGGCQRWW